MGKFGCYLLGAGTLKSALSQEKIDELAEQRALLLPNPYIHTNEKQCLPPSYTRQLFHFYKKILIPPPSMSFQKSQPPINRGLHTINILYTEIFTGFF